jgi:DNA-binding transcriptional regulator LsrR (DeoR family)
MEDRNKLEITVKAAQLYYEYDFTQQEIARELNISRSMVSRLITEARRTKLVEILIHYPWLNDPRLEAALKAKYRLRDVRVLNSEGMDHAEVLNGLGKMGAGLLEKYLKDGMTLGIARGSGVFAAVQALRPQRHLRVRIAQLQGAMGETLSDGSDIAHFLSTRYQASFHFLHAPLYLESREATQALMKEPSILHTLKVAKVADLALVGIGSVLPQASSLLRTGHVSEQELQEMAAQGIVGDVAGRHIDVNGDPPNTEFSERLICVELADLRRIPVVVGVAGGRYKVPAIRAALCGQLVNVLAIDSAAAEELVER